jgi:predicted signal transduction protein with EAL and GGDEF domain
MKANVRTRDLSPHLTREHDLVGRLKDYCNGEQEDTAQEPEYLVARIGGGEEFAIIFNNTHVDEAYQIGERVREAVESARLPTEKHGDLGITVSIGVTEYAKGMGPKLLMKVADKGLYRAKEGTAEREGRNLVCIARLNPQMPVPSAAPKKLTALALTPDESAAYAFGETSSDIKVA